MTDQPQFHTTKQVAAAMGITTQRVAQLVNDGMPRIGRGRYNLNECLEWRAAQKAQESEYLAEQTGTMRDHKERILAAKAEQMEHAARLEKMKADAAAGVLMHVEDHRQNQAHMFNMLVAALNELVAQERDAQKRAALQARFDDFRRDVYAQVEAMASDAASGFQLTPAKIRNAVRMG